MLLGYSKHAEITHPGESVLCIEYETDYLTCFFGIYLLSDNYPQLYASFFNPLFTTVSCSYFHDQLSSTSILKWTRAFFWSESHFAQCVTFHNTSNHMFQRVVVAIVSAISVAKLHFGAWACAYFFLIIAIKNFQ